MEFYNPKVFGYNFIFDGLVRMPARWLCSNPVFLCRRRRFTNSNINSESEPVPANSPNRAHAFDNQACSATINGVPHAEEICWKVCKKSFASWLGNIVGKRQIVAREVLVLSARGREGRGLHCSFYRPIYIGGIGIKKCGNIWRMRDPRN